METYLKRASTALGRRSGMTMFFGLVGLAGIVGLLVLSLWNEYRNANQQARIEVENISRLLQEHALATVHKADLLLREIQRDLRPGDMRAPHSGERARQIHELLKAQLESVPEVALIHVSDASGNHIYSSMEHVPHINIADRYHFRMHQDNAAAGLVISPPLVSRTSGKWTIVLTRRVSFENGGFAGVINVVLDLDYFQSFYRTLNLGPHGVVALYDKEFHLAARYPPNEKGMGKAASIGVRPYIERGATHGVYHVASPVDGTLRLLSFRQAGDLPLIVFAGIAENDYLAEWRRHVWLYGIGTLAFSLVVIGFGVRQRRSETLLRAGSIYARNLIETSLDPLVTISAEGKIMDVNSATEKVTGVSRDTLIGSDFSDYFTEPEQARTVYRQVFSEGQVTDYPLAIRHRDGTVTDVIYNASLYRDAEGNVAGVFAAARDVTERKRADEQIRQLNETLEKRVQEEVAKNREKDHILIQQSRLAAMGEMVHNIAHQWRQPLNALSIILSNIKDEYDYHEMTSESLDKTVKDARHLLQRMSSTVDDFRDFFRPDHEPGEFDMSQSAEDALFVMEASLKNNRIEVVKDLPKGLMAYGYSNQFAQVILNVLANAKESIQLHGVTQGRITVSLRRFADQGILAVEDNGRGIPVDILPKIFDPYFTTKDKGSGIGLYMSKMITERNLNGKIEAANVEQGALVTITLPLPGKATLG